MYLRSRKFRSSWPNKLRAEKRTIRGTTNWPYVSCLTHCDCPFWHSSMCVMLSLIKICESNCLATSAPCACMVARCVDEANAKIKEVNTRTKEANAQQLSQPSVVFLKWWKRWVIFFFACHGTSAKNRKKYQTLFRSILTHTNHTSFKPWKCGEQHLEGCFEGFENAWKCYEKYENVEKFARVEHLAVYHCCKKGRACFTERAALHNSNSQVICPM